MLLKIGGIIDIQGFHVNDKFYPRQLAIITGDTIVKVVDFKTGINYHELSCEDRRNVKHVQRNIHYLELEPSIYINAPHSADYSTVIRRLCADHRINRDRPLGVNNPQTEIVLTTVGIPFVTIRGLIRNLPDTETIIKYYTRGSATFSAANKVASLWRLILSKQFEIRNKPSYDHLASGGEISPLATLITEVHEAQREGLSRINGTLCRILNDLMRLSIEGDEEEEQECAPPTYTES